MRIKPAEMKTKYQIAVWEDFVKWADANGIGEHPDDWHDNWLCWAGGAQSAINNMTAIES